VWIVCFLICTYPSLPKRNRMSLLNGAFYRTRWTSAEHLHRTTVKQIQFPKRCSFQNTREKTGCSSEKYSTHTVLSEYNVCEINKMSSAPLHKLARPNRTKVIIQPCLCVILRRLVPTHSLIPRRAQPCGLWRHAVQQKFTKVSWPRGTTTIQTHGEANKHNCGRANARRTNRGEAKLSLKMDAAGSPKRPNRPLLFIFTSVTSRRWRLSE
jgi:hypothetical protein